MTIQIKHDFKSLARKFAATRKKEFSHDRSKTVGASEIGKCFRRVVYAKTGTAVDEGHEVDSGFGVRGDVMEDGWTAPFTEWFASEVLGGRLLYAGQGNQLTFANPTVGVSATPDGLAVDVDVAKLAQLLGVPVPTNAEKCTLLVEMKSFDPRIQADRLPKPEHIPQTILQSGVIQHATEYHPIGALLLYVNASDYYDIRAWFVPHSEQAFESLVERAVVILQTKNPDAALPEGKMRGGRECAECPYARRCLGYRPFVVDEDERAPTSNEVRRVEKIAERLKKYQAQVEAARLRAAEVEADLYAEMASLKRRFVKGSKFAVTAKKTAPQARYDVSKLKARIEELGGKHDDCKTETKGGAMLLVEPVA